MSNDTDIIEAEYTVQTVNPKNLPSTEVLKSGKISPVDAEFEYARSNIINILQTSNSVLKNTALLVTESEHPRMVEVYSSLIKNLADINKSLLGLREKKMKMKGELIDEGTTTNKQTNHVTNNNTIFVGSTEELMQSMKG